MGKLFGYDTTLIYEGTSEDEARAAIRASLIKAQEELLGVPVVASSASRHPVQSSNSSGDVDGPEGEIQETVGSAGSVSSSWPSDID